MKFRMNWSQLSDDEVKEERDTYVKWFAHAAATDNGAADAHARNADEANEELWRRGINPFKE
jgi:hypothetical protein